MSILGDIRKELKAPKNLYNSFGKYKYRNFESICEAIKPLLTKYGADLVVTDSMAQVGDRNYVRATAILTKDGEEVARCEGWAREQDTKKGMDDAQLTGTTSSYARKYAVNGLFLIDDTKDPDTDEYRVETENRSAQKAEEKKMDDVAGQKIGVERAVTLMKLLVAKNVNIESLKKMYNVADLSDLTEAQHADIVRKANK